MNTELSPNLVSPNSPAVPAPAASTSRGYPWLFSAPVDLGVFLGSALASLALLALGGWLGILQADDTPGWAWVPAILLIDVAHVWSTGFRVWFDPVEWKRRPWLYALVPICGYLLGVALYSEGEAVFWRALAYLAVFHFVRQQYGWVALYRARAHETGELGRWIDTAAIYLATVYPLVYWHTHLPRRFWWFKTDDFLALPETLDQVLAPIYWMVLLAYLLRSLHQWLIEGRPNPGKDIVVLTTAACWHVGIITFDSDYAFTVTNVIIHGVPYLALVYWYRFVRGQPSTSAPNGLAHKLVLFLTTVWLLAYAEELLWHRGIWQDKEWLFGEAWEIDRTGRIVLAPLLALPQVTHYVLDGFIWKRRSNPAFTLASQES